MDYECTLVQKIVLWALLAMAVVFAAVNIILKCVPGVSFEGTLLKITEQGAETLYTGSRHGDDITVSVTPEGTGHRMDLTIGTSVDQTYRVEYPGGTIEGEFGGTYDRIIITCDDQVLFEGGYKPSVNSLSDFCNPDGTIDLLLNIRVDYPGDPWHDYQLSAGSVMSFVNGPETATRGSWGHYIVALIGSVLCAVAVAFPRTLLELRYHWVVRDPEPTETYLMANQVCGVILTVVILVVYISGAVKIV